MTEIKWSLVFLMLFLAWCLGQEYEIQLIKELEFTQIQYHRQLDSCLEDTLREAKLYQKIPKKNETDSLYFSDPDEVCEDLLRCLEYGFAVWNLSREELKEGILLLVLYDEKGFTYYTPDMGKCAKRRVFSVDSEAEKTAYLEDFMEEIVQEATLGDGQKVRFSFPKNKNELWAQGISHTGLLLLYRAPEYYYKEKGYERIIFSGARVEDVL